MNCDVSWKFSAPLKLVDVNRILKEAGPYAKCVRFSIDGKMYTAVNSKKVGVLPNPVCDGDCEGRAVTVKDFVERSPEGEVLVCGYVDEEKLTPWRLYKGDVTHDIVDRVKVSVEVYK